MNGITVVRRSSLTEIVLDRPPVNALTAETYAELTDALRGVDEETHCVVLRAIGKGFCAGADLHEAPSFGPDGRDLRRQRFAEVIQALAEVPVPVIAAVHGYVIGGGVALIAMCDTRIAADDTVFSLPEIDVGGLPGAAALLPRIGVSPGGLREMLFTGARYSATEAQSFSLIDRVVPAAELADATQRIAERIAAKERRALIRMKRAINRIEHGAHWTDKFELLERDDA